MSTIETEEIDKNNVLYQPNLKPDRSYRSESKFSGTDNPNIPNYIPDDDNPNKPRAERAKNNPLIDYATPKKLIKAFTEIEETVPYLPESLHFIVPAIIEKLKERLIIAYPNGISPAVDVDPKSDFHTPDTPKITDVNIPNPIPINSNPALKNLPQLFPKTVPVKIEVQDPKTLVELIRDGYDKDQIRLDQYYLQKLQFIMQKYFQQMITLMAEVGASDVDQLTQDFDGEAVKVPKHQSLAHLRDHIVRSQVAKDQKTRLFHKTHCTDQTLQHMRAWHIAEKQRERYYGEKYGDSGTFTQSQSNALLRECRSTYDENYSSTLYNMYKYLDSSVNLVNDVLNMTAKEGQAKSMLFQNGVNIYETKKTQAVANTEVTQGANTTTAATAEDSSSTTSSIDSSSSSSSNSSSTSANDDSGVKSPNGTDYSSNDIQYLVDKGYTKEDAIDFLATCDKYKAQNPEPTETNDGTDTTPSYSESGTYVGGNSEEIAPNGYHYANNDIQYLTDQGYSKEDAIEYLSSCDKYKKKEEKQEDNKNIFQTIFKGTTKDPTSAKNEIPERIFKSDSGCFGQSNGSSASSTADAIGIIGSIIGGKTGQEMTEAADIYKKSTQTAKEAAQQVLTACDKEYGTGDSTYWDPDTNKLKFGDPKTLEENGYVLFNFPGQDPFYALPGHAYVKNGKSYVINEDGTNYIECEKNSDGTLNVYKGSYDK